MNIAHRSRLAYWIAGAMIAIGTIAIVRGVQGAERVVPGPHEITLVAFGKDYDAGRTLITISGAYEDRAACVAALARLRVLVTGMKPVCFPTEQWRVN
jgi:hypothetical protein